MLYPNPSSSTLSIKTEYQGTMNVEILSLSAEKRKSFENIKSDEYLSIKDLPKGDYLVRIWIKGELIFESRLIKNE